MALAPNNYLIIGTTENWNRAFEHNPPVWGFTERGRAGWEPLKQGDILYFYAAKEARGIIGKGVLLNKFQGGNPYWSEEENLKLVKWNLRFYFQPVRLLPPDLWHAGRGPVVSSDFGVLGTSLQRQIVPLSPEQVASIEKRISTWPTVAVGYGQAVEEHPSYAREKPRPSYEPESHPGLVKIVEQIGALQNFYPQTEFSIPEENRRIDVVWRREVRGTPTYAFEVELSGGLDKALNKLYKCFRLWSTLPRVITPSSEFKKVEQIASSFEPKFKQLVIPITPTQLQDLYERKKGFKDVEKEIGLL